MLYENIQLYETIQQHALKLQLEITERKRIENDLLHSQERLKLALEAGRMNSWEWDIQANQIHEFGYFSLLSSSYLYSGSEVKKGTLEHFMAIVLPDDQSKVFNAIEDCVTNGGELEIEFRSQLIDGSTQWFVARGQTYKDATGLPRRMVGISTIITEQKETRELARVHQTQLARIERVNSMGEMASTLAHELSQPLTVINTYISGCIRRLEDGSEDKALIIQTMQKAMQNVELAGEIIHRMKNFVREGELHYEKTEINVLIKEVVSLFYYETHDNPVTMQFEFTENLPLIEVDKIQIEQVLLNLIRNACEAMHNANILAPSLTIKTHKSRVLTVSVIDNGPGIALNVSQLLFSPYYTTKANGMGMGLAICRTIIEVSA